MSRVVLTLLAPGLALAAVLAFGWQSEQLPQDAAPLGATAPSAAAPELEAGADGPDGPRLESGVSLEGVLAQRARRLGRTFSAVPTKVEQLARSPGWTRHLSVWLRLPEVQDDAARLARLSQGLAQARDPVVRQNLIFLAALSLPETVAAPWLNALRAGADPADAEDALVALAMRGEPRALASFESLAAAPADVDAHRLIDSHEEHDLLGEASTPEARVLLRSYRAVETRIGEPYFKLTAYLASRLWSGRNYGELLRWQPPPDLPHDVGLRLLKAWLARYPGHPGSDNVALWIGRLYARHGDQLEAARWCSRAAVLPDQDVADTALQRLVTSCELLLTPEQVLHLGTEDGLSTPNRHYCEYVWLRRLAAERGPEEGLRAWADLAAREPSSELAIAWARRFALPPPAGLDSGSTPLPADDPLRRVEPDAPRWPAPPHPQVWRNTDYGRFTARWGADTLRLEPWPEPMVLDRSRLDRQARAWETLAELERRAERARGAVQADLLYKQAAVLYHDRDVFYPAYGAHSQAFRSSLSRPDWQGQGEHEASALVTPGATFERTSFAWLRALALFERLEQDHPRWSDSDKVIFSQGLSWRRLVDYRPLFAWLPEHEDDRDSRRGAAARQAVACFERLVSLHPQSTLVPDARAAAAWWRKHRATMLR